MVRTIAKRLNWLSANTRPATVKVLKDTKIAIKTITSKTVDSKTVFECINSSNNYSQHDAVPIIWVPLMRGLEVMGLRTLSPKQAGNLGTVNLDDPKPLNVSRLEFKYGQNRPFGTIRR